MALSNILNEPRREITEQVIGTIVAGGLAWLDWSVASYITSKAHSPVGLVDFIFLLVLLPGVVLCVLSLLVLAVMLIHAAGEVICDLIAGCGLDPRPRQRYNRD